MPAIKAREQANGSTRYTAVVRIRSATPLRIPSLVPTSFGTCRPAVRPAQALRP